jgi:hypothetical protein
MLRLAVGRRTAFVGVVMRFGLAVFAVLLVAAGHAAAATTPTPLPRIQLQTAQQSLGWIKGYRAHPNATAVPDLVKQLAALGAFQEPEGAGLYVGFMAGVLGANPKTADKLATSMAASLQPADQWAVIKAVAYSRLTDWRGVLQAAAPRMPTRGTMVEAYLSGKLPSFERYQIPKDRSAMEQVWRAVTFAKDDPTPILEPSPMILDMLWGYYFATGSEAAIGNIGELARWSKETNDLGRLTVGSAAKYSLAANASRDQAILQSVKTVRARADKQLGPILDEAIFAAETTETGKLHDDAARAIEDLRTKGPANTRKVAWWGKTGEGAISLGCVVAAVTGQVELGIPCVIGGAVASAALKYFATP